MIKILVTCAGGFQGLTLFKGLKNEAEIELHGIDINSENIGKYFFDYFDKCPPIAKKSLFETYLENYCRDYAIDFIVPASANDLLLLSSLKDKFLIELNVKIVVPDPYLIEIFINKRKTLDFLKENKLSFLEEIDINNEKSFPIFGKPIDGWGGKDTYFFRNISEFESFPIKNLKRFIWQPFLFNFTEYSVDFSISYNGKPSLPIVRERIFTSGGFALISTTLNDMIIELRKLIFDLIEVFSLKDYFGLYNVQIIQTNNFYFVSDINPRIGTSAIFDSKLNYDQLSNIFFEKKKDFGFRQLATKGIRYLEEKYFEKIEIESIKGIVFDLDDTLISNKEFIIERSKMLYEQKSELFGEFNDYVLNVIQLLNEGMAPNLIDKLAQIYDCDKLVLLETYQGCFPNKIEYYREVPIILQKLKLKYRLYVLTDNPKITQLKKIDALPFSKLFDGILYTDDINNEKPAKACFDLISKYGNHSNDELVMVGDNYIRDCKGAIDSGFRYSFHINRIDSMVSHLPSVKKYFFEAQKIFELNSLTDLFFYLEE